MPRPPPPADIPLHIIYQRSTDRRLRRALEKELLFRGACYLLLLPRRHRYNAFCALGYRPALGEFLKHVSTLYLNDDFIVHIAAVPGGFHISPSGSPSPGSSPRSNLDFINCAAADVDDGLLDPFLFIAGFSPSSLLTAPTKAKTHLNNIPAKASIPDQRLMNSHPLKGGAPLARVDATVKVVENLMQTAHKEVVTQADLVNAMASKELEQKICPYALTREQQEILASLGLVSPGAGTSTIDHPVNKVIENTMLHVIAPQHIRGVVQPCFIKPGKCSSLKGSLPPINPRLSARDHGRYYGTKDDLGQDIDCEQLFAHDVAHYWTPDDFAHLFNRHKKLQRIYITVIVPNEVILPLPRCFPGVYTVVPVDNKNFHYQLEGNGADFYEQPFSCAWLMKTREVNSPNGSYQIELLHSIAAHRFLVISRGSNKVGPTHTSLKFHDAVILPKDMNPFTRMSDRIYSHKLIDACISHCASLNTYRDTDAYTKLWTMKLRGDYDWITPDSTDYAARFIQEYRRLKKSRNNRFILDTRKKTLFAKINLALSATPYLSQCFRRVCKSTSLLSTIAAPIAASGPLCAQVTHAIGSLTSATIYTLCCLKSAIAGAIPLVIKSGFGAGFTFFSTYMGGWTLSFKAGLLGLASAPYLSVVTPTCLAVTACALLYHLAVWKFWRAVGPLHYMNQLLIDDLLRVRRFSPTVKLGKKNCKVPVSRVDRPDRVRGSHFDIAPPHVANIAGSTLIATGLSYLSATALIWLVKHLVAGYSFAIGSGMAHPALVLTISSILIAPVALPIMAVCVAPPILLISGTVGGLIGYHKSLTERMTSTRSRSYPAPRERVNAILDVTPEVHSKSDPNMQLTLYTPLPNSAAGWWVRIHADVPFSSPLWYDSAARQQRSDDFDFPDPFAIYECDDGAIMPDASEPVEVTYERLLIKISALERDPGAYADPYCLTDAKSTLGHGEGFEGVNEPRCDRASGSATLPVAHLLPSLSLHSDPRPQAARTSFATATESSPKAAKIPALTASSRTSASKSSVRTPRKKTAKPLGPPSKLADDPLALPQAEWGACRHTRDEYEPCETCRISRDSGRQDAEATIPSGYSHIPDAIGLHPSDDLQPSILVLNPPLPIAEDDSDVPQTGLMCLWKALEDQLPTVKRPWIFWQLRRYFGNDEGVNRFTRTGWSTTHLHLILCLLNARATVISNCNSSNTSSPPNFHSSNVGSRAGQYLGIFVHIPGHFMNQTDNPDYTLPEWAGDAINNCTDQRTLTPPRLPLDTTVGRRALTGAGTRFSYEKFRSESHKLHNFELHLANHRVEMQPGVFQNFPSDGFAEYHADRVRAKRIVRDIKDPQELLGKLLPKMKQESYILGLDSIMDHAKPRKARVLYACGYGGCGKSFPIFHFLNKYPSYFIESVIVFPENTLRNETTSGPDAIFTNIQPELLHRATTWEKAALEKSCKILVVDEVGKMPPGYVDFMLFLKPEITHVILLGDPTQLPPSQIDGRANCLSSTPEGIYWTGYASYYCFWTNRLPTTCADVIGIKTTNPVRGHITVDLDTNEPVGKHSYAFMSIDDANKHNGSGKDGRGYSARATQGFTFKDTSLALQADHSLIKHGSWRLLNMLLGRSKRGFTLYSPGLVTETLIRKVPCLEAIFYTKHFNFAETFAGELQGLALLPAPPALRPIINLPPPPQGPGRKRQYKPRSTHSSPINSHHIVGGSASAQTGDTKQTANQKRNARRKAHRIANRQAELDFINAAPNEIEARLRKSILAAERIDGKISRFDHPLIPPGLRAEHVNTTHPTTEDLRAIEAQLNHPAPRINYPAPELLPYLHATKPYDDDPEAREETINGEHTEQFITKEPKGATSVPRSRDFGNAIHQLFPEHTAANKKLLPFSIKKRLPLSTREKKESNHNEHFAVARHMWKKIKSSDVLPPNEVPFDDEFFQSCVVAANVKKINSKPIATLANKVELSTPDIALNEIKIFAKAQMKVKRVTTGALGSEVTLEGTYCGRAKACQTVSQHHDAWILIFGGVIRYLDAKVFGNLPPRILVLGGKSPAAANEWCLKNYPKQDITCSMKDYTAFDQSQTKYTLYLEKWLMEYYNIPTELIDLYWYLKLRYRHQFCGKFTEAEIMRFSGEPGTYFFNTFVNLCALNCQHDLSSYAYAVSGDDSLILGNPPFLESWANFKKYLPLVVKPVLSRLGNFCGYYYTRYGIIRICEEIAHKLAIAVELNNFDAVALSYAIEIKIGTLIGHNLVEVLSDYQLDCHFAALHYLWDHGNATIRAILSTLNVTDEMGKGKLSFATSYAKRLFELPSLIRTQIYLLLRSRPQDDLQTIKRIQRAVDVSFKQLNVHTVL